MSSSEHCPLFVDCEARAAKAEKARQVRVRALERAMKKRHAAAKKRLRELNKLKLPFAAARAREALAERLTAEDEAAYAREAEAVRTVIRDEGDSHAILCGCKAGRAFIAKRLTEVRKAASAAAVKRARERQKTGRI
jgi:hypothetical protein